MLREKRPFQINSLRCTASSSNVECAYTALVRYSISPDIKSSWSSLVILLLMLLVQMRQNRHCTYRAISSAFHHAPQ